MQELELNRTCYCDACDMDSAGLTNPVSSVNGLLLYGWIPPLHITKV